jgi:hypothetical protein
MDPTQRPTMFDDEASEADELDEDELEEQNPFTQLAKSQRLPTPVQPTEQDVLDAEQDLDTETVRLIGTQSAKKWKESEGRVEAEMQGFREMMDVTPSKPGSRAAQPPIDPDLGDQEEMQGDDFLGHLTQMQSRRKEMKNTIDSPATASRRISRRDTATTPEPSPTKVGQSVNPYYPDSPPSPGSSRNVTPRRNLFARGRSGSPTPNTPPGRAFAMGPKRSPGVSLSASTTPTVFDSPGKNMMTPSKLRFVSTGPTLTLDGQDEDDVFMASTARDKLVAAIRSAEFKDLRVLGEASDAMSVKKRGKRRATENDDEEDNEVLIPPPAQARFKSDSPTPPPPSHFISPPSPMLTPAVSPRRVPATSILKRRRPDLVDNDDTAGESQLEPPLLFTTQVKRARFASHASNGEGAELEPTLVSQSRLVKRPRFEAASPQSIAADNPPTSASTSSTHSMIVDHDVVTFLSQDSSLGISQESIVDVEPDTFRYVIAPPSSNYVQDTIRSFGEPDIVYQKPYFSVAQDVPATKSTYGTRTFHLKTNGMEYLPDFQFGRDSDHPGLRTRSRTKGGLDHIRTWEYRARPPSRKDTARWLEDQEIANQDGMFG